MQNKNIEICKLLKIPPKYRISIYSGTHLVNNLDEKYLVYSFYGEVNPALGLIFKAKPEVIDQIKAEFMT